MAKSNARLGRGLDTLITRREPREESLSDDSAAYAPAPHRPHTIPIDAITPNRHQPRSQFRDATLEELAASIRKQGVVQPILVRRLDRDRYELIAGERRWRAARLAGLAEIPVIIRDVSEAEALELALIENLQREDLGPLERATGYEHYIATFGGTIEELAERLGESRASVSNYLRLLRLSEELRRMLSAGELGMGQARAIASIEDPQRQLAIARLAVRRNLSVRQVEELVRNASDESSQTAGPSPRIPDRHVLDVEQTLSKATGLRVRLRPGRKKNSGRIVIWYSNLEEFDRVAEKLGGHLELE